MHKWQQANHSFFYILLRAALIWMAVQLLYIHSQLWWEYCIKNSETTNIKIKMFLCSLYFVTEERGVFCLPLFQLHAIFSIHHVRSSWPHKTFYFTMKIIILNVTLLSLLLFLKFLICIVGNYKYIWLCKSNFLNQVNIQ